MLLLAPQIPTDILYDLVSITHRALFYIKGLPVTSFDASVVDTSNKAAYVRKINTLAPLQNINISHSIENSEIVAIAAVGKNGEIAIDGKYPHSMEDKKFFKTTTMGGAVIMGSVTAKTLNKPLSGRVNFIVSKTYRPEDQAIWRRLDAADPATLIVVMRDLHEAVALARQTFTKCFIVGGQSLYEQCIDDPAFKMNKLVVSHLSGTFEEGEKVTKLHRDYTPRSNAARGFLPGWSTSEARWLDDGTLVTTFKRNVPHE